MTLQQLKYIVAINRYRNFAKAADACGISQPTLSAMLVKLEEELDVRIFERSNKSVQPTSSGEKIIRQAERTIAEAERITWLVNEDKGSIAGELLLAIGPTIAPYILPKFIRHYVEDYPSVKLRVMELKTDAMLNELLLGHLDAGIAISGNMRQGVLEIPLYTERFMVYLSEHCWRKLPVFRPENLEHEKMWVMKEAQCLRESAFSFCKARTKGRHVYEAGSIDTLIADGGVKKQFKVIKELYKKADTIVNCGDAGQEGELIQRWVMELAGVRYPVKRLWISSLIEEAIRDGFNHLQPQSKYDSLYRAGQARAEGDWLLGMNATRLYTLKYGGYKQVLSIGRVQTPTLAMI